MELEFS